MPTAADRFVACHGGAVTPGVPHHGMAEAFGPLLSSSDIARAGRFSPPGNIGVSFRMI
jgi:hypothetical protein